MWIEKRFYRVRCVHVFVCVSAPLSWMTAHSPSAWNCPSKRILSLLYSNRQACTVNVTDVVDGKNPSKDHLLYIITLWHLFHRYSTIYSATKYCSLLLCVPRLLLLLVLVSPCLSQNAFLTLEQRFQTFLPYELLNLSSWYLWPLITCCICQWVVRGVIFPSQIFSFE